MVIPLGMGGGAVVGVLVSIAMIGIGESGARRPGDPGDAHAMLGVFFMLPGTVAGTVIGLIVAAVLYLKRKRELKFE